MRSPSGTVLLVQPIHQHAYETAVALAGQGALDSFVTLLYADESRTNSLPIRLRGLASRRSHPELPQEMVTTMPILGIAHLGAMRTRKLQENAFVDRLFSEFERRAASLVQPGHAAVHVFEGTGLKVAQRAKLLGIPIVLDVPSIFETGSRHEGQGKADLAYAQKIRQERELADILFVPSARVREALLEAGIPESRIESVAYGVDVARFRTTRELAGRQAPLRLLWVGNTSAHKGLPELLMALTQVRPGACHLRIVGAQDTLGRELRREHPSHDWVGSVPKSEVQVHFAWADVLVLPTQGEGSSLAVLEAMAAGCAVVTTPLSGAPIEDGLSGLIMSCRDPDVIRRSLELMSADRHLVRQMGDAGASLVGSMYSWTAYRERVLDAYRHRHLVAKAS